MLRAIHLALWQKIYTFVLTVIFSFGQHLVSRILNLVLHGHTFSLLIVEALIVLILYFILILAVGVLGGQVKLVKIIAFGGLDTLKGNVALVALVMTGRSDLSFELFVKNVVVLVGVAFGLMLLNEVLTAL